MNRRPNILWLMSDQHHAGVLGCAGHPDVRTPHLDRLAGRGVRFDRAYCNNPICGPSRSSFLTGQYVKTHGVSGNHMRELAERPAANLAQQFREAGYETGFVGKAHLPAAWMEDGFSFIRYCDLIDADPEDPRSCHYFNDLVEAGLGDAYDHGKRLPGQTGHGMEAFVSEIPDRLSLETWTGDQALAFLRQRDRERPFFLKVSFQRPHDPYAPPPECADWYDPGQLSLPDNAGDFLERRLAGKPAFQQTYAATGERGGYPFRPRDAADLRVQLAGYYTLVTMIDREIGRIVAELEAAGELDDTLIIYVADHGDFAGEHGLMLKNLGIYEAIHRIPWIMAGPGLAAGKTSDALIESVDFYPTLAEAAGLPVPDAVEGRSHWHREKPAIRAATSSSANGTSIHRRTGSGRHATPATAWFSTIRHRVTGSCTISKPIRAKRSTASSRPTSGTSGSGCPSASRPSGLANAGSTRSGTTAV
jgi:arylsulfatase A-like enzyme